MATVDPGIYLSRDDILGFNAQSKSLGAALRQAAKAARRITILSAYYNTNAAIDLFRNMTRAERHACALRLVFSVEHEALLMGALEPLRELRTNLAKSGFRSPEVKLYRPEGGAPLHSKLYHFVRGTQPVWFIGSANLSGAIEGDRHEMMVRLAGSHKALQTYMDAVVERAVTAQADDAGELADAVPRNLRSFFLSGFICYSPREQLGMTFEACKLSQGHRNILKRQIEEKGEIRYANAQAEGFGFSLHRALTNDASTGDLGTDRDNKGSDRLMARFKHLAVETSLGYWLPRPYADIVRASVQKVEDRAEEALLDLKQNLAKQDINALKAALAQHIDDMQRLVPSGRDQIKPKVGVEQLFERFVDVRREKLSDVGVRRRLARRLQLTRLPDFWGDQEAVQEFEETFFSDLALRLRRVGNVPRIARAFRDQLGFGVRGTSALRKALESHLEDKGWELGDWPTPGQVDQEEQEDEELDDC